MGTEIDRVEGEVLILGGGLAALRAAVAASDGGTGVVVATRGKLGRGGSSIGSGGGFAVALGHADPEDSVESHIEDTVNGGRLINHRRLVEILCSEGPERILELDRMGGQFKRMPDGRLYQSPSGEHRHARVCQTEVHRGTTMTLPMTDVVLGRGVRVIEKVVCLDLLHSGRRVCGALLLDPAAGRLIEVRAAAVILAVGGAGRIYKITSNPSDVCGDGYAMAYRAGAELQDMEMVQFYPWRLIAPIGRDGRIPVQPSTFVYGGKLYNRLGERFMERFDPERLEATARDVAARGIYEQIRHGRDVEGGVVLDLSDVDPQTFLAANSRIATVVSSKGLTLEEMEMIVTPEVHFFMGGVRFGPEGDTNLPGLFVAGEVAGGVHGANRLNGNAVTETQVFGARAGRAARRFAADAGRVEPDPVVGERWRARMASPARAEVDLEAEQERLRERMWHDCGIVRVEERLLAGRRWVTDQLAAIEAHVPGDLDELERWARVRNMATVADLVLLSALTRTESRGAHFRDDHPETRDEWLVNVVVGRGEDGPEVRLEPVPMGVAP
ncbi:MAG TPA: FAD-binding protein [Candidatus Dormibacteraeota bacterium]|nr:FAD-binding protein [Candidatus Dormibacteraeota bacterium]